MLSPTEQTRNEGTVNPVCASHESVTYTGSSREANLSLIREIVVHLGIIDSIYGMRTVPGYGLTHNAPASHLPPAEMYLSRLGKLNDEVLRKQAVRLQRRLIQAAQGIKLSSRLIKGKAMERYATKVRELIKQTSSPTLYLQVLIAMMPAPQYFLSSGRALDDLLLAVALRMWSSDETDKWAPAHPALEITPSSWVFLKSLRSQPAHWKQFFNSRGLQFMMEAERINTLQMLVAKVTTPQLPAELSDCIFTLLLGLRKLPHPRDLLAIWVPWPSQRPCGLPDCLTKHSMDSDLFCTRPTGTRWSPTERRFIFKRDVRGNSYPMRGFERTGLS